MPKPSATVTTAPTTITVIQCLPRLRPSQPQNLCTGGPPSRCLAMSRPDVTADSAQTEGEPRDCDAVWRQPDRFDVHRGATLCTPLGRVAELADAQASGACVRKDVGVQVPPRPRSARGDPTPDLGRARWRRRPGSVVLLGRSEISVGELRPWFRRPDRATRR